jgi:hypothetical protein
MNRTRLCWILFAAVAVAVAAAVVSRQRAALRIADPWAAQRRRLEIARLQEENRRLRSEQLPDAERRRLELVRSEGEFLRARLAQLQEKAAHSQSNSSETSDAPREVSAKDWIYAGRADPAAAIESVLWSASRGDVEQLAKLICFAPEVRPQADALYGQLPEASKEEYGSPEKVVATLLAGIFPKDADTMTLVESHLWEHEAAISMRVGHSDSQARTNLYRFRSSPDGWQLEVPASIVAGCQKVLTGGEIGEADR